MSKPLKDKTIPVTEALHWEIVAAAAKQKKKIRAYVEEVLWKSVGKTKPEKVAA